MAGEDEVILWRGVPPGGPDPAREVTQGFESDAYPGDGPYFATERRIAEDFAVCYGHGIQELHVPRHLFDLLVAQGVIQSDGYYPPGQSWHVPPDGLPAFNAAIRHGPPNQFHRHRQSGEAEITT